MGKLLLEEGLVLLLDTLLKSPYYQRRGGLVIREASPLFAFPYLGVVEKGMGLSKHNKESPRISGALWVSGVAWYYLVTRLVAIIRISTAITSAAPIPIIIQM